MAKHAKEQAVQKVNMPLPKFIGTIVFLILLGFCIGYLAAYILIGGFPVTLLTI